MEQGLARQSSLLLGKVARRVCCAWRVTWCIVTTVTRFWSHAKMELQASSKPEEQWDEPVLTRRAGPE